jgi:hypothetical protein
MSLPFEQIDWELVAEVRELERRVRELEQQRGDDGRN